MAPDKLKIYPFEREHHSATRGDRGKVRSRARPARFDDDRRRLDDRLGHLHRLGRDRAPGRLARLAAGGLGGHRPADRDRPRSPTASWRR